MTILNTPVDKAGLIYLASPYAHKNPDIQHQRYEEVNKVAGELMLMGHNVFSPLSHSVPIDKHLGIVPDLRGLWMKQDFAILQHCDRLVVLEQDGWRESEGVRAEIKRAIMWDKPVSRLQYKEG